MRRTFKKTLAVLTAMVSLTVCVSSFGASATVRGATINRIFDVGVRTATASVSLGYVDNNYYGASTSSDYSDVIERSVTLMAKETKSGALVIEGGNSMYGTAACATTTKETFKEGTSTHSARYSGTGEYFETTMNF